MRGRGMPALPSQLLLHLAQAPVHRLAVLPFHKAILHRSRRDPHPRAFENFVLIEAAKVFAVLETDWLAVDVAANGGVEGVIVFMLYGGNLRRFVFHCYMLGHCFSFPVSAVYTKGARCC